MRIHCICLSVAIGSVQLLPKMPGTSAFWLFLLLTTTATLVFLAASSIGRKRLLALFLTILLGFSWSAWRVCLRLDNALPSTWEGREITITGFVSSLPVRFSHGERFTFEVERVETPGATVPNRIGLAWYGNNDPLWLKKRAPPKTGERWQLTVKLKKPHGNANWHGFDYEAWLLERSIRATGYLMNKADQIRLDELVVRPQTIIDRLRDSIRNRFQSVLSDAPYAGILIALAVGDQNAIEQPLWQIFNRTGTTHLMSISGLHVTMVAAFIAWLTSRLWRTSPLLMNRMPAQRAATLAGMMAAFGYALLAGFAIPAQRTFFMLFIVTVASWKGRSLVPSRILPPALALVSLIDPWAVLAPGFWLSFVAVAVLLFVHNGRGQLANGWKNRISSWTKAQAAVTLGTLPLLLFFFQQFSLVSPFANAIAIPLVSLVVTPLALIGVVIPYASILDCAHWVVAGVMKILTYMAEGNGAIWWQPDPPWWGVLLAACGVFCLTLPRALPGRPVGLLLLLPALFPNVQRPLPGKAHITVLDVGQGLAVHIQTASHDLLYDTGPGFTDNDAGLRTIVPYLRGEGVRRLSAIIVSHEDNDHAGGLNSLLAHIPSDRLLTSFSHPGAEACRSGQQWTLDEVTFEMLYPENPGPTDDVSANHQSCTLKITADGKSLLLTGDLEKNDEAQLITGKETHLKSTVLLAPHHGSRTSSSAGFIQSVAPEEVVFSVGYRNRYGHPHPAILSRYTTLSQARIWRTDLHGAIRVYLNHDYRITTYRQLYPRYWRSEDNSSSDR